MASNTLKMKFGTSSGVKTWSFPNAKASPSSSSVKELATRMIANGSIYKFPPLELQSAYVEIVTQNNININE